MLRFVKNLFFYTACVLFVVQCNAMQDPDYGKRVIVFSLKKESKPSAKDLVTLLCQKNDTSWIKESIEILQKTIPNYEVENSLKKIYDVNNQETDIVKLSLKSHIAKIVEAIDFSKINEVRTELAWHNPL